MENNKKKIRYSNNRNGISQSRQVPVFDVRQLFGDSRKVRLRHCGGGCNSNDNCNELLENNAKK